MEELDRCWTGVGPPGQLGNSLTLPLTNLGRGCCGESGAREEWKTLRPRRPQADLETPRSKGPCRRKQAREDARGRAWSAWKYARGAATAGQRASLFPRRMRRCPERRGKGGEEKGLAQQGGAGRARTQWGAMSSPEATAGARGLGIEASVKDGTKVGHGRDTLIDLGIEYSGLGLGSLSRLRPRSGATVGGTR